MSKRSKERREHLNQAMGEAKPRLRSLDELKMLQVPKPVPVRPEAKPVKRSWLRRLFRI